VGRNERDPGRKGQKRLRNSGGWGGRRRGRSGSILHPDTTGKEKEAQKKMKVGTHSRVTQKTMVGGKQTHEKRRYARVKNQQRSTKGFAGGEARWWRKKLRKKGGSNCKKFREREVGGRV